MLKYQEKIMKKAFFVVLCIMVCSISALALPQRPVPEIDGSSLPAVIALVSGGILMLRARFRSK
jgi:hypothetical protein